MIKKFITFVLHIFVDKDLTDLQEKQWYRKLIGGYWSQWKLGQDNKQIKLWIRSCCENHVPLNGDITSTLVKREKY